MLQFSYLYLLSCGLNIDSSPLSNYLPAPDLKPSFFDSSSNLQNKTPAPNSLRVPSDSRILPFLPAGFIFKCRLSIQIGPLLSGGRPPTRFTSLYHVLPYACNVTGRFPISLAFFMIFLEFTTRYLYVYVFMSLPFSALRDCPLFFGGLR